MTDPERPPSPNTVAAREEAEKQRKATEAAEQAQLPYSWTQSIGDVDVSVPVDGKLRGRDMDVYLGREGIRVGVKGESPILEGQYPHAIDTEESSWTLETTPGPPGKEISIHLDKKNKMEWWAHVVTSAPKIDVSKITPENSKLSDLDGETRKMVEKMMVEQREKEAGGGGVSGEEKRKRDILADFQRDHPEMDFSNAKIG